MRRRPAEVLPTDSCGAGGYWKVTAIEGAVVHWLVLSVSVSLQAGAGAALCLVWGRGAVVGAFPEGGGVPIGS